MAEAGICIKGRICQTLFKPSQIVPNKVTFKCAASFWMIPPDVDLESALLFVLLQLFRSKIILLNISIII